MLKSRVMRTALAAAVLTGGTMGSIEWPGGSRSPSYLMRGGFTISTAVLGSESTGPTRRTSCTLVRYYVARYSAAVAEAWARGKGATDAEILKARRCVGHSGETNATG